MSPYRFQIIWMIVAKFTSLSPISHDLYFFRYEFISLVLQFFHLSTWLILNFFAYTENHFEPRNIRAESQSKKYCENTLENTLEICARNGTTYLKEHNELIVFKPNWLCEPCAWLTWPECVLGPLGMNLWMTSLKVYAWLTWPESTCAWLTWPESMCARPTWPEHAYVAWIARTYVWSRFGWLRVDLEKWQV